jgi:hypothetical protein
MSFGAQPNDSNNIPISSIYRKEDNTFPALQAEPGAYLDTTSNQSSAAVMSFLRPLIVQKAHNVTGSGGKTLTCAFTNNNIAGNSIVVVMGMGEVEGANITLAITDTTSNTYTQAVKASQSTTLEAAVFYATSIASGSNSVTITIAGSSSSNTAIAAEIYEIWGLIATAGALDQTAIGNAASGTSVAAGAISPIAPNEFAFAAVSAAGGTITAGTGSTLDSGTLSPTGGNLVSFGSESQQLSTFASITPSATLGTSNAWAMAAATFKSIMVPVEATTKEASCSSATLSSVASSASSVTLLSSNSARRGMLVFNDSTAVLYLAYAATATTSAYTVQITPNGYWEMPKPIYPGAISGIWASANGNLRITELY